MLRGRKGSRLRKTKSAMKIMQMKYSTKTRECKGKGKRDARGKAGIVSDK